MAAPVTKDQELELTIDRLAYGGNGVARLNGFVVFVRRGLPGDTVRARVTKVQRRHAEALVTEVVQPSPLRVEAPCQHYPACGGCRFQDLAYEAQVEAKHAQVGDALRRIGGFMEPPLEEIMPAEEIFHYRNKLEYSFTQREDGPTLAGLFKQKYRGSRYSWGYPACPELEEQTKVAELLQVERIGVTLTEESHLVPEQSTSAIIVPHPEAKYFVV